ncbi:hypothetical protein QBC37DRAFT_402664 [Rhypophila decipiens]|uniref:DUF6536 domain-containing protein n=1 Tax=Rhypophila decipiens TaxID=261697 RepID=A0AAN7B5Z0_9PEZI|nr:hypothetical protein QBC37DRAFT_402664 [Rhypophila decipiens]
MHSQDNISSYTVPKTGLGHVADITWLSGASREGRSGRPSEDKSFQAEKFGDVELLSQWFPKIKEDGATGWRKWRSRRSRALLLQLGLIFLILIANVALTGVAVKWYGSENGVGLIYQGDCDTVETWNRWIHLLINLLSTGMLGASNYCMQLQAAPTRAKVDEAHRAGKSLDIGVPSLRNFGHTTEANRAADPGWNERRVNPTSFNYSDIIQGMQAEAQAGRYQERNLSSCFDLYDDYFQPQGNGIIFVKNASVQSPPNDSLLMYVSIVPRLDNWPKNMWALGKGDGGFNAVSPQHRYQVTTWYLGPKRYEVSHCLVQPPEQIASRCRFEYSKGIMITICVVNVVKAVIVLFIWGLRKWRHDGPNREPAQRAEGLENEVLYTLGDAIASFMRVPDPTTIDMGLAGRDDFVKKRTWKSKLMNKSPALPSEPRQWKYETRHWREAASPRRWFTFVLAWFVVMAAATGLLFAGLKPLQLRRLPTTIRDLWDLGFGALTPYTYIVLNLPRHDPDGLIRNILIANLPQLILSIIYILYNGLLSTFLVQREFSRMYKEENMKALRVSEPDGIQRSSYFISLPLRYGIPLYASSGIMHWLISQSLFLARISALTPSGELDKANSFSTCGFSPIAIVIALSFGGLLMLVIVLIGFRSYAGTMRLVSTNSRAISAACHVLPSDRKDGYLLPVRWGVVEMRDGVGKCAFSTSPDIKLPVDKEGLRYR